MKLLSIITLTYNSEEYLEKTAQSLIQQKKDWIEYIIVDGGSTDRTFEILERLSDSIDLVVKDVKGISESFNAGVKAATGKWVGFLNSGDEFFPDALLQLKPRFEHSNAGVIAGAQKFEMDDDLSYVISSDPSKMAVEMSVNHQGSFVLKSVYEQHGYYLSDYKYAMDYEFYLRLFVNKVDFETSEIVVAKMIAGGVSDKNWLNALKEVKRAKISLLGSRVKQELLFVFLATKMFISKTLIKMGLFAVVRFYRKNFALVKKV